jgi:hypothetical protein
MFDKIQETLKVWPTFYTQRYYWFSLLLPVLQGATDSVVMKTEKTTAETGDKMFNFEFIL